MGYNKLILFINTVKYLKPKQVFYRLYYFFKKRVVKNHPAKEIPLNFTPIMWKNGIDNYTSFDNANLTFNLLNISHSFKQQIDWNYDEYGKLWTYNLNYFDYLNQNNVSKDDGVFLIKDFIRKKESLIDGNEPYPISLRCINWVKFLTKNKIHNIEIDRVLYNDFVFLSQNLEYHLLANHLLENGFSLLFGAYYFQDEKLYHKSKILLNIQLNEQLLNDGGHFELSPMYHQIILSRLLDCIYLIQLNNSWKSDSLLQLLTFNAGLMASWLENITYQNGSVPMVNDSTSGIAPTSEQLFSYIDKLNVSTNNKPLSDSGYRKIKSKLYELFIDVGKIGPDYQPGHAHSDTLSFELHVNHSPLIVDTGISTYEKNTLRKNQRETSSHNTVKIFDWEQSEVWGGFRVAKRAKITSLIEKDFSISARHNGYEKKGYIHERTFKWTVNKIEIIDTLNKATKNNARAYFHLHSSLDEPIVNNEQVIINDMGVFISFSGYSNININSYKLSCGFNISKPAYKIVVDFDHTLTTQIQL